MIKNLTKPMVMEWLGTFTADDDIVGLADGGYRCPINNCLTAMFPEGQWHTAFWSASDRAHKEKVKWINLTVPVRRFIRRMVDEGLGGQPVTKAQAIGYFRNA